MQLKRSLQRAQNGNLSEEDTEVLIHLSLILGRVTSALRRGIPSPAVARICWDFYYMAGDILWDLDVHWEEDVAYTQTCRWARAKHYVEYITLPAGEIVCPLGFTEGNMEKCRRDGGVIRMVIA